MVLRELLTLTDYLATQSFCQLDILRVHLKSMRIVGQRVLTCDQQDVLKNNQLLFNTLLGNWLIWKKQSLWKSNLLMTPGSQETAKAVIWPCGVIISSIGHFESTTEVWVNSWWKAASLQSTGSSKIQAHFIKQTT